MEEHERIRVLLSRMEKEGKGNVINASSEDSYGRKINVPIKGRGYFSAMAPRVQDLDDVFPEMLRYRSYLTLVMIGLRQAANSSVIIHTICFDCQGAGLTDHNTKGNKVHW